VLTEVRKKSRKSTPSVKILMVAMIMKAILEILGALSHHQYLVVIIQTPVEIMMKNLHQKNGSKNTLQSSFTSKQHML
jgi:hypothetical protein